MSCKGQMFRLSKRYSIWVNMYYMYITNKLTQHLSLRYDNAACLYARRLFPTNSLYLFLSFRIFMFLDYSSSCCAIVCRKRWQRECMYHVQKDNSGVWYLRVRNGLPKTIGINPFYMYHSVICFSLICTSVCADLWA